MALFQTHPGGERIPIASCLRSLLLAEENYWRSERGCIAVVWSVKKLRPYLIYERFTIFTDHTALHWLLLIDDPSGRLIWWRLRLAEFEFDVKYKKGKVKTQADALSRLNKTGETIHDDENDDLPVFFIERVNVELECKKSPKVFEVIDVQYAEIDEHYADIGEPAPVIKLRASWSGSNITSPTARSVLRRNMPKD